MDKIQEEIKQLLIRSESPDAAKNPMRYIRAAAREYGLSQMNKCITACNKCSNKCRTHTIVTGHPDAAFMVIMDYPTDNQAKLNKSLSVFEGNEKVETFLRTCFESNNVDFDKILFMNAVNCCRSRTVKKDHGIEEVYTTPTQKEIDECGTFVRYTVDLIHPYVIILMGNVASNIYIKKKTISKIRGQWQSVYCIPAMPTYSPHEIQAYEKQDPERARQMLDNLQEDINNAIKVYKKIGEYIKTIR